MEQEKSKNLWVDASSEDAKKQGGRWYDCAFCKRGFTNAQALGGHMNIHRKDKDKAKKKNLEADSLVRRGFLPHQIGHVVYMPPPAANHEYSFFPVWRPDHIHIHGNQTLMHVQDHQEEDEDVDLELRLGPLL